jgi:phosphatidylserine decarboxylase
VVRKIVYTKGRNLPMTLMWWRVLFRRKPYEFYSNHILSNERNTIMIEGELPVYVVQIADIYVNKIECWVKEGDNLEKGQRIGMIKMGSQVDLVFPAAPNIKVIAVEGQKVKAGESIIAQIT